MRETEQRAAVIAREPNRDHRLGTSGRGCDIETGSKTALARPLRHQCRKHHRLREILNCQNSQFLILQSQFNLI